MEFRKLSAPSLKEMFVEELEHMILSGKLKVGEKLPSERELAASMQISRAVVNAGIAELEKKGFLVVRPRIGTFVEDYRKNGTIDTLISILNYNGSMLKDDEIRSILEVRIVLDTLAIRLIIDHATDEEIFSLEPYLARLAKCDDAQEAVELAYEFHHTLGIISGNSFLPLFFSSFKSLIQALWFRYCQRYSIVALYKNRAALYYFLRKRDKESAIAHLEQTLGNSIDGTREIYY